MALRHFKSWTEVLIFSLDRADFWGSREPGGEPAELDPGQSEPPDVYRTNREVRSIQKPTGEKNVHTFKRLCRETGWIISTKCWCFCILLTRCVSVSCFIPWYRTTCWGGRRRVKWPKETKRLCWRWVCFSHTAASLHQLITVPVSNSTLSKQWLGC